jgi:hypothetical protein
MKSEVRYEDFKLIEVDRWKTVFIGFAWWRIKDNGQVYDGVTGHGEG